MVIVPSVVLLGEMRNEIRGETIACTSTQPTLNMLQACKQLLHPAKYCKIVGYVQSLHSPDHHALSCTNDVIQNYPDMRTYHVGSILQSGARVLGGFLRNDEHAKMLLLPTPDLVC